MKMHEIKLREEFADAVASGEKSFEVRKNDRDYQCGDLIRFRVVDAYGHEKSHLVEKNTYKIGYVLSGWGIRDGYAVFGIESMKQGQWRNLKGEPVAMIDGVPLEDCLCSECGDYLTGINEYPAKGNYCPNCGAKMEGVIKND